MLTRCNELQLANKSYKFENIKSKKEVLSNAKKSLLSKENRDLNTFSNNLDSLLSEDLFSSKDLQIG